MNQPFGAMPSPFELANKNKSTTVTMSLRVKQTTKDFFEQQAKMIEDSEETDKDKTAKTSASSLMNNLLDSYVESYLRRATEAPVTIVLKPYLENMAKKIVAMDDESLIFRAFRSGKESIVNFWEFETYNGIAQVLIDFKTMSKKDRDGNLYGYPGYPIIQTDNRDIWIRCVEANENGADAEFEMDNDEGSDYYRYVIYVTPEKWPTTIAVVDSYVRKMQELTGEKDEDFSLSAEKFKELVDVINSTNSKEELVKKLTKFFVEYAEQVYE